MSKSPNASKTRAFSIMTYCSKKQIDETLSRHHSSIRAFAYIYHDKDEAEPHYHIIFRTFDAWSIPQIEKWWKHHTDANGEFINTFVQRAGDLYELYTYLTHADEESKKKGKHLYDKSEIVSVGALAELVPTKDACDDTYEMLEHMVKGAPTRWMVRRYGKAFVYHYTQFSAVAEAMRLEDCYNENKARAQYNKEANLKPIPLDQESLDI